MTKLASASLKRVLGLLVHSSLKISCQHSTEVKKATLENIQTEIKKKHEISLCYNSGPIFPSQMPTSSPILNTDMKGLEVSSNKNDQPNGRPAELK